MCGILGYSGEGDRDRLAAANHAQSHRGPDGYGFFQTADATVGLGHLRLAILDLSDAGCQPMSSPDGRVVIVFNGEIYNYRELRERLVARGHSFRGASDTEVLLSLYLDEGAAMLPRLNGIFAFAIWDERNRSLLIARDALGVKPLYVAQTSAGVAFASEIKALLRLTPPLTELDIDALQRYLTFLWCPGDATPLRQVRKVLPGEAVVIKDGSVVNRWTWYELPVFRPVGQDLAEVEAVAGTVSALRGAVHRQLVADVPVGAFLSGGLDSSAVVAFAREQSPDIRCFTIAMEGGKDQGQVDDLPYARRVARHLNVPLDVVTIDSRQMADDIEGLVEQLDEPLADPAPLNVLYISRLARQAGIKVLLSGTGGDDLFTGYRRHTAVAYEHYWNWLPSYPLRALAAGLAGLDQRNSPVRRLTKLASGLALDGDARLVNHFRWTTRTDVLGLFTNDARAQSRGAEAGAPMLEFLGRIPHNVGSLDRMLALEQRFFLADHNLIYTDKMSMAAGVEVRVPFLDLELVDFAARVPVSLKQRGRVGKWVLKKAMEPFLPREVIYRPKAGFGAPLRRWMRNELRPFVGDVLSRERLVRRGLFEPDAVQSLITRNQSGQIDAAYTILSLVCIELWCGRFLDRSQASIEGAALATCAPRRASV